MRRRTGVNAEFFQSWSADMAYVLGVVCADGCLVEHTNGYHCLNITTKDLSWLQQLQQTLQAERRIGRKRRAYQLQIRNQPLYRSLLDLGLTPRKSKTLQLPLRTTFTSGSLAFLEGLRRRLSTEAALTLGSLWSGVRAYCLQYTIQDSLRLYDFMYRRGHSTLCLTRKQERFERFKRLKDCNEFVATRPSGKEIPAVVIVDKRGEVC